MQKPKMIPIQLQTARQLVRLLDRLEEISCVGCTGLAHEADCPAREAFQMRNNLTRRVNNRKRHFTV